MAKGKPVEGDGQIFFVGETVLALHVLLPPLRTNGTVRARQRWKPARIDRLNVQELGVLRFLEVVPATVGHSVTAKN
jgi:hypothetical protein